MKNRGEQRVRSCRERSRTPFSHSHTAETKKVRAMRQRETESRKGERGRVQETDLHGILVLF